MPDHRGIKTPGRWIAPLSRTASWRSCLRYNADFWDFWTLLRRRGDYRGRYRTLLAAYRTGQGGRAVYFGRHRVPPASRNAKSMRFNPLGICMHDATFPKHQVDAAHLTCLESCDRTISSKAHTFGTFERCCATEGAIGASLAPFGYALSEARLHLELWQWSSTCVSTARRLVRTHVPCGTRASCRACWLLCMSSSACQPMLPHALANLRTCASFNKTPARRLIHDR